MNDELRVVQTGKNTGTRYLQHRQQQQIYIYPLYRKDIITTQTNKHQHYTNKQTTKSQLLPVTQEGYHHYTNKQQHYTNKQTNNKKPAITRYTGRTSQQQQQQQSQLLPVIQEGHHHTQRKP